MAQLVDGVMVASGARTVPVTRQGRFAGIISLTDIRQHPREQWDQVTVGQAMTEADQLHTVQPEQNLNDALPLMVGQERDILPVVSAESQLVGILSHDGIVHLIELRRGLNIPYPSQKGTSSFPKSA